MELRLTIPEGTDPHDVGHVLLDALGHALADIDLGAYSQGTWRPWDDYDEMSADTWQVALAVATTAATEALEALPHGEPHEEPEVIPDRFCNRWIGGSGPCQEPATMQVSPGRPVNLLGVSGRVKPQYRCPKHAPTTAPRRCAACGIEVVDHEGTLHLAMLVGDTWSAVAGGARCTRSPEGHR